MAEFLLIHGANCQVGGLADLQRQLTEEAITRGLSFSFHVPDWRNASGFTFGAASLTLPHPGGPRPPGEKAPPLRFQDLVGPVFRHRDAEQAVTDVGVGRRRDILDWIGAQLLGDIFSYPLRRTAVHQVIDQEIAALKGQELYLVGHSLGGIILVDYLASHLDALKCPVVTLGTPAPLMFALDSIDSLRYSLAARPYTPWINVWDGRDLLSFLASRIFEHVTLRRDPILDIEVSSGKSARVAHSDYWHQDGMWAALELAVGTCEKRTLPSGIARQAQARALANAATQENDAEYLRISQLIAASQRDWINEVDLIIGDDPVDTSMLELQTAQPEEREVIH